MMFKLFCYLNDSNLEKVCLASNVSIFLVKNSFKLGPDFLVHFFQVEVLTWLVSQVSLSVKNLVIFGFHTWVGNSFSVWCRWKNEKWVCSFYLDINNAVDHHSFMHSFLLTPQSTGMEFRSFCFCVTGNSTISRPPSHEDFLVMDNNDDLLGFRSILYNLTLSLVIGFF